MYGGFETARAFSLQPSGRLLRWLTGVHLLAVALLLLLLPWVWALLAMPVVVLSAWHGWWQHFGGGAIRRLVRGAPGEWQLLGADGVWHQARLRGDSVVWPRLMVLGFDLASGGPRRAVILVDSMSATARRRLRVIVTMTGIGTEEFPP